VRAAAILLVAILLPWPTSAADPPLRPADVIAYLARNIDWYRHIAALEQTGNQPVDLLARESAQRSATRSLQFAFDFGRAAAPLLSAATPSAGAATPRLNVDGASIRAVERVANAEAQLAEVDAALAKARGPRAGLAARRNELLAELNFAKQIRDSVQTMRAFLSTQAAGGADLLGIIDRMERTVPEALRTAPAKPDTAVTTAGAPFRPENAGIFALIGEIFGMARARTRLDAAIAETNALRKSQDQLRAPLVADLTSAVRRGEAAVADSATQTPEQMDADRREIEALGARFKQLSAVLAPLREHGLQIDLTRSALVEQREAAQKRYQSAGVYLLYRAAGLVATILLILGISVIWKRAAFRYVRDVRRRKQFLVVRRIVVSAIIGIAIAIGLVNEMGSLATYAGFLTAGLAVALQNPIASVVAYFFLIGRYGLKVGDRVTIAGVTGDVVEIGLVRLYLMELTGAEADLHPTGRIVGFSNSVLFQPAAIFRQMPGADYVWHAATVTLAPETDPKLAETKLMAAVDAVCEPGREKLERQHAAFQRLVDVPVPPPKPVGRLRHTNNGLEFVVRYAAEMRDSSATDDRVLDALAGAVAHESGLALAPAGAPRLQSA
jgi:small-conductance mechanosensitive channel